MRYNTLKCCILQDISFLIPFKIGFLPSQTLKNQHIFWYAKSYSSNALHERVKVESRFHSMGLGSSKDTVFFPVT